MHGSGGAPLRRWGRKKLELGGLGPEQVRFLVPKQVRTNKVRLSEGLRRAVSRSPASWLVPAEVGPARWKSHQGVSAGWGEPRTPQVKPDALER